MVFRHLKRCSTSLITKEMRIKTAMRYHLPPVRIAIIKKSKILRAGEDVQKRELLCTLMGLKMVQLLWKAWRFPPKLKVDLTFDSAVLFWAFAKEDKTPRFIVALFTTAEI